MLGDVFCVFVQLSVSYSNLSAGRGEYVPTKEEPSGSKTHLQMHENKPIYTLTHCQT